MSLPFPTRTAAAPTALRRVLLVDDEAIVLRSVGRLLERQGYRVATALSGEDGLAALAAESFDAIICDMQMPGLGGAEFYDRLVALHPQVARRVIFATGDARLAGDFLRRTGCPYLEKPYELTDLLDILTIVGASADS
jgi:DNA-binding NtrC family response regulator